MKLLYALLGLLIITLFVSGIVLVFQGIYIAPTWINRIISGVLISFLSLLLLGEYNSRFGDE